MSTSKGIFSPDATQHKNLISALIGLVLTILTVAAFWQLKNCGFINFDDNNYVYENASVQTGLNANSIVQAFSSELAKVGHWHPLTWLSLMLDYELFGLNPQGFHLINLLFHVVNTLLLFLVLRRMTKRLWPSAFVACLFAIHPLHVESVAWVTERKDVLSTFFWMLTLGAYSYYVESPGVKRYVFVLLFFVLGLLAKPMLITLPFVLLLLDYWPLQRFSEIKSNPKVQAEVPKLLTLEKQKKKSKTKQVAKETLEIKKSTAPEYSWSRIYPLLWEKVPLFILVILSIIVTYLAAQSAGAVSSTKALPLGIRMGNVFISYIAYIGKMIWPSNLAIFYPYPKLLVPLQIIGSILLLVAITLAVFWRAKKSPYLATGWLWYLGTLVPVIGIVQAGSQAMADRYTYISLIGLFIMVAWGVPDLLKKWKYRKEMLISAAVLILLGLSIKTWTQAGYWQNNITLYDHTLKVTDHNWFIYNNRGNAHKNLSHYRQAIEDYNKAIEIKPDEAMVYSNRGIAYKGLGHYSQAIEDLNKAIEIKPNYAEAYSNRGNAYAGLSHYRQAIEDYNRAIEMKPGFTEVYINRGAAYNDLGHYRQAVENYDRAIETNPGYADAYYSRAAVYLNQGNNISGCSDAQKACELGNCKLLEAANTKGLCR